MRKFKEGDIVDWYDRDDGTSYSPYGYEVIKTEGDITFIRCTVTTGEHHTKTSNLELRNIDANKLTTNSYAPGFFGPFKISKEPNNAQQFSQAKNRQEGGEYYKVFGIEPWDVIDTWPMEQRIGYCMGNLLKYTMRCGLKDAEEIEIGKAFHYAKKLLEVLAEKNQMER